MRTVRLLAFAFLLSFSATLTAQSYITAAGVRIENGLNLTLQQRLTQKWTVEGILHTPLRSDDIGLTVLAERHHKILFRGLNVYYGVGGHYYWQSGASRQENEIVNNVTGISGIAGAEVSFGRLNVAFDFKPELHITGDTAFPFEWNGYAISARYILFKQERKQNWKFWEKDNKKNSRKYEREHDKKSNRNNKRWQM